MVWVVAGESEVMALKSHLMAPNLSHKYKYTTEKKNNNIVTEPLAHTKD